MELLCKLNLILFVAFCILTKSGSKGADEKVSIWTENISEKDNSGKVRVRCKVMSSHAKQFYVNLLCPLSVKEDKLCYYNCTAVCSNCSKVIQCKYNTDSYQDSNVLLTYIIDTTQLTTTAEWQCQFKNLYSDPIKIQKTDPITTSTVISTVISSAAVTSPASGKSNSQNNSLIINSKPITESTDIISTVSPPETHSNIPIYFSTESITSLHLSLLTYIMKPELVLILVIVLGISLILNLCFLIRCVLLKSVVENYYRGLQSTKCVLNCLCLDTHSGSGGPFAGMHGELGPAQGVYPLRHAVYYDKRLSHSLQFGGGGGGPGGDHHFYRCHPPGGSAPTQFLDNSLQIYDDLSAVSNNGSATAMIMAAAAATSTCNHGGNPNKVKPTYTSGGGVTTPGTTTTGTNGTTIMDGIITDDDSQRLLASTTTMTLIPNGTATGSSVVLTGGGGSGPAGCGSPAIVGGCSGGGGSGQYPSHQHHHHASDILGGNTVIGGGSQGVPAMGSLSSSLGRRYTSPATGTHHHYHHGSGSGPTAAAAAAVAAAAPAGATTYYHPSLGNYVIVSGPVAHDQYTIGTVPPPPPLHPQQYSHQHQHMPMVSPIPSAPGSIGAYGGGTNQVSLPPSEDMIVAAVTADSDSVVSAKANLLSSQDLANPLPPPPPPLNQQLLKSNGSVPLHPWPNGDSSSTTEEHCQLTSHPVSSHSLSSLPHYAAIIHPRSDNVAFIPESNNNNNSNSAVVTNEPSCDQIR